MRKTVFFKLLTVAIISYVFYLLAEFIMPIMLAVALALASAPLVGFFSGLTIARRTIKMPRSAAITCAIVSFCLFFAALCYFMLQPLVGQINYVLSNLSNLLPPDKVNTINDIIHNRNQAITTLPTSVDALISDALKMAMSYLIGLIRNVLVSSLVIVQNLVELIIVPFLAFYFLEDWRNLRAMMINLFSEEAQPKVAKIIDDIGAKLSSYVRGLMRLSILSGLVITAFTASIGIKFYLVLGLCAVVTEILPYIGPLIGALPATFFAYQQSPSLALLVALFYFAYYQIDSHYILPKILGNSVKLHPVIVIISLLIGAKLFGIMGMIFAVPVAAVYKVLYDELWHYDFDAVQINGDVKDD